MQRENTPDPNLAFPSLIGLVSAASTNGTDEGAGMALCQRYPLRRGGEGGQQTWRRR
jgi:hypothetical protein